MTLGEIIAAYLDETGMSVREFARRCGSVSYGYISMLIRGENPKTGKPIRPNIDKVQAIASGLGISLDELLRRADDFEIELNPPMETGLTVDEAELLRDYRNADPVYRRVARELLREHPMEETSHQSAAG
jgi:transcriptional regulator with XRE-family HTH domain